MDKAQFNRRCAYQLWLKRSGFTHDDSVEEAFRAGFESTLRPEVKQEAAPPPAPGPESGVYNDDDAALLEFQAHCVGMGLHGMKMEDKAEAAAMRRDLLNRMRPTRLNAPPPQDLAAALDLMEMAVGRLRDEANIAECRAALSLLRTLEDPTVVIDFPSKPGHNINNRPLFWLYTHCRAIGMTERAEPSTAETDIALFTVRLKERAEKAERETAAPPAGKPSDAGSVSGVEP